MRIVIFILLLICLSMFVLADSDVLTVIINSTVETPGGGKSVSVPTIKKVAAEEEEVFEVVEVEEEIPLEEIVEEVEEELPVPVEEAPPVVPLGTSILIIIIFGAVVFVIYMSRRTKLRYRKRKKR